MGPLSSTQAITALGEKEVFCVNFAQKYAHPPPRDSSEIDSSCRCGSISLNLSFLGRLYITLYNDNTAFEVSFNQLALVGYTSPNCECGLFSRGSLY